MKTNNGVLYYKAALKSILYNKQASPTSEKAATLRPFPTNCRIASTTLNYTSTIVYRRLRLRDHIHSTICEDVPGQ
jgi:hypothetical protein